MYSQKLIVRRNDEKGNTYGRSALSSRVAILMAGVHCPPGWQYLRQEYTVLQGGRLTVLSNSRH